MSTALFFFFFFQGLKSQQFEVPEEQISEVEDPKLTNSSSSEESEPDPVKPSPMGVSDRRELAGILTGGGGGTIGKRNFS